ncbi:hypothetical protein V8F20_008308 [Naviculisporaceae sp. PSN 640]
MSSSRRPAPSGARFAVSPDGQTYPIKTTPFDSAHTMNDNDDTDFPSSAYEEQPNFIRRQPSREDIAAYIQHQKKMQQSERDSRREENKRQRQHEMALVQAQSKGQIEILTKERDHYIRQLEMEREQKVLDEKFMRRAHQREMERLRSQVAADDKSKLIVAGGCGALLVDSMVIRPPEQLSGGAEPCPARDQVFTRDRKHCSRGLLVLCNWRAPGDPPAAPPLLDNPATRSVGSSRTSGYQVRNSPHSYKMSQHARKSSLTARDHMIARHSRPNHQARPSVIHPAPSKSIPEVIPRDNETPTSRPQSEMLEGQAIITSTSALDLLTTEGELVNLHSSKHVAPLSHAMSEMKRLDIEFGNTDAKGEAERELLLQEMLPDFLPMRAVWKQEWNILRRRKAELLHDRWEQGIRGTEQTAAATLDLASQFAKTTSNNSRRPVWLRISRFAGYTLLVVVLVAAGLFMGFNIQPLLEAMENISGMDFFL